MLTSVHDRRAHAAVTEIDLSVVVSVLDEEAALPTFWEELCASLAPLGPAAEVVFVDDGSTDRSPAILAELARIDPRVTVVTLSRNFGHEAAMIAGVDHARGAAVIVMDADLQHPPSLIAEMMARFDQGDDVVLMARTDNQGSSWAGRRVSRAFYGLLNRLSRESLVPNASDFFLVSARVADLLRHDYRERIRFLRGIIQVLGFRRSVIPFSAPRRAGGCSKYSVTRLVLLSLSAIASFSNLPLNLGVLAGLIVGLFGFGVGVFSIMVRLAGQVVPGYTTIVVLVSLLSAIQLFVIGLIGQYLGYLFDESKRRPIYLVDHVTGGRPGGRPTEPER